MVTDGLKTSLDTSIHTSLLRTVMLSMTDLRGSKLYTMIPDGQPHRGRGFMGLPVETRVCRFY